MKILLTGSKGFIGKHLSFWLLRQGFEVLGLDLDNSNELSLLLNQANFIIHLAGITRPQNNNEFYEGNYYLTKKIVDLLKHTNRNIPIIFASSTQTTLNNDYGKSKKMAEEYLFESGLPVYVYRLANVFGKWSKPNYNSVCATYCYNIAHNIPIEIRDPNYAIHFNSVEPIHDCTLGHLAELIKYFKITIENTYHVPDIHNEFELKLFETFCDYFSDEGFSFNFVQDNLGSFKEIYKSSKYGQISINETFPKVRKGGHYHTFKKEIFLTILGKTKTRLRKIGSNIAAEYISEEKTMKRISISPGYTHDITNIDDKTSKTLIWISEIFNEKSADTIKEDVDKYEKEN
jgi:UDP-2-acetamido-2,6-beta-L-arabino-hexul-4-ose reductase